jgi:hypothetical protein
MAQKSRTESDTNASPARRPTASEETGANLTRAVAGNVIDRHSLVQREPGSEAPTTDPQSPSLQPEKSSEVGPADIGSQVAAEDSAKLTATQSRTGSPTPSTAEVAAEQGAGSLGAIQQGSQMRDIGSQAALASGGPETAREHVPIDNARHQRIAIAAYYRAELRGFEPGYEMEDWLEAEREVGEREGSRGR